MRTTNKRYKADHKQVTVLDNDGDSIEVDEGMVDLLRGLWANDINTWYSCQKRQDGTAYIYFASGIDFERFVENACDFSDKLQKCLFDAQLGKNGWEISVSPVGSDGIFESLRYVVSFPPSAIQLLTEAFS